jgi:hypothetical protein
MIGTTEAASAVLGQLWSLLSKVGDDWILCLVRFWFLSDRNRFRRFLAFLL